MLRFGPADSPVMVAALPLFEEGNRTRTFTVTLLRALAERGVASALPDLPGQGESLVPTDQLRLANLRAAYAAAVRAVARRSYGVSIRSGALIDGDAELAGRWQLTPQTGAELRRELDRARTPSGGEDYAGNRLSASFLSELDNAVPRDGRVVRLDSDPRDAALRVSGPLLWRRAEPDNDPAFAALLANDLATWLRACEG